MLRFGLSLFFWEWELALPCEGGVGRVSSNLEGIEDVQKDQENL